MASSTSSMWSALENQLDPSNMLHSKLASALSDAQYWEETISGSTIRSNLQETDPSNPASAPVLLKAMKWLLASISKGRDVSDFYVEVVKLVGTPNFEVRKIVYTYLVQYANHNADTRELSLLSINSFQRGLNDSEPLIRALALRVLTSVQQPDIVQIQILAVTKHARADTSPYVRKCAGIAMAKLAPRCDEQQKELLLEITEQLLNFDTMPMVLSSALVAFAELTNGDTKYLHLLHHSYRKLCELLADIDEWGQVICMEILTRYCRFFFKEPRYFGSGSAEQIDATRRVKRRLTPNGDITTDPPNQEFVPPPPTTPSNTATASEPVTLPPYPRNSNRKIIKRRVVKKGFYSDEEDESTEEEVYADTMTSVNAPPSAALRQADIGGSGPTGGSLAGSNDDTNQADAEESDLDPDHLALLHAALPLLKSRNAGVVLAVCSLHYYCGVSSIKVRKAMGKALVRIHRDRHHQEIQYVVLSSIQRLVHECPSAFAPFLNDFFVLPDLDLSLTRLLKLDILTALALDPPSIQVVLAELRMYVQVHHHDEDEEDLEFVCAAVRAVGRVVELARICYSRQGRLGEAHTIALNCLFGLTTLAQTASHETVVGETVCVMATIFPLLEYADDPNRVQERAFRFVLLLLVHTLSCIGDEKDEEEELDSDDDSSHDESDLEKIAVVLPPVATASGLWLVGGQLSSTSTDLGDAITSAPNRAKLRADIAALLVRGYLELEAVEKVQALHFACKLLASADGSSSSQEGKRCEELLALGRLDVDVNIRDRARHLSGIVRLTLGIRHDNEAVEEPPLNVANADTMSLEAAKRIFLSKKSLPSYLPLADESGRQETKASGSGSFRFGTLSSLVGHRARSAYQPLPPWAIENSPSSLRDELAREDKIDTNGVGHDSSPQQQFYGSSSSDESDSSSSDDDTSSSSSNDSSSSDNSSTSDSSSDTDSEEDTPREGLLLGGTQIPEIRHKPIVQSVVDSSSDSESSEDLAQQVASKPGARTTGLISMDNTASLNFTPQTNSSSAGLAEDFEGMTLAPVVTSAGERTNADFDFDSGVWNQLVRPEHSRGLCVQGRYLRGVTKSQQALLLGLTTSKPTVVCIQVRFQNQKPAGGSPFRHVRIVQKSSATSASSIGPSKIVAPLEISQLDAGSKSECVLGIDFAQPSDRNGSLLAKLEIKFGSGGIPTELKPTIGDLLLPCIRSLEEFDSAVGRMRGFNRVESNFTVPESSRNEIPMSLVSRVALNSIGANELAWDSSDTLRLAGTLPASADPVYVVVTCTSKGHGKIVVCCDHALVVTAIMSLLKRSLSDTT